MGRQLSKRPWKNPVETRMENYPEEVARREAVMIKERLRQKKQLRRALLGKSLLQGALFIAALILIYTFLF